MTLIEMECILSIAEAGEAYLLAHGVRFLEAKEANVDMVNHLAGLGLDRHGLILKRY